MPSKRKDKHNYPPQYQFDLQTYRAMQTATWILTNRESKERIQCNYQQMSNMVEERYIQYHNQRYEDYDAPKISQEDTRVRVLKRNGCDISDTRYVTPIGYREILPEYTIDCYGYSYQCNQCKLTLKETKKQGHDEDKLFCPKCLELVEVY